MDAVPYKFDPANPRVAVTNAERPMTVYYASALLFLFSLRAYQRKVFRLDNNALNFALFTGASAFASYQWASFFLSTPEIEAAAINNKLELQRS